MRVTIIDRGRKSKTVVRKGEPLGKALHLAGYHKFGQEFWHIWRGHKKHKPGYPVQRGMRIDLRHVAAGPLPP